VGFGIDQNAQLGIPGPGGITVSNGISLIGGGDGRYIEYLGDFGQYVIKQKTLQLSDALTLIRGPHTLKFGGTLMQRRMFQTRTQFGKGFYFYRDGFGFAPGRTGYEVSDMLIGVTDFTATGNPGYVPREVVNWENSLFAQDDWRVNRKLTLNLGLRYDVFTPYYEKDDKLANYDPATGTLVLPGVNGAPRSTVDTDTNNIGPRAGFAYLINDRTVVRGSYGIFYTLDRGGIDNQLTENPPAIVTEFRFGDAPGANVRISDPIPLPTPVDPNNPQLPQGSGLVFIPRDTKSTMVQQFSVGVQRELTSNTAAALAYVGTRGDNITARLTAAGFAGAVADRLTTLKNIGTSKYDSIQASLRRSLSGGLSYLASYTLSWAKDDVPSLYPGSASRGAAITDINDLSKDFGYADYDSRHRFTLAGTYELPFAKDNKLLGGWSVNTVLTLQSGNPFTAFATGGGPQRADVSGDPNDGPKTSDEWFNTGAFSAPAGAQGTSERGAVRAPGIKTLDLSLFKNFGLGGRANLEIRIEGFNVFNSPQYSQPNNVLNDPNFGKITGTRLNSERQVQLAARVTF
jgi:outer membrane receptor protein involved in Fe transport